MTTITAEELTGHFHDLLSQANEHDSFDPVLQSLGVDIDELYGFTAHAARLLHKHLTDSFEEFYPPTCDFERMLALNLTLALGIAIGMKVGRG